MFELGAFVAALGLVGTSACKSELTDTSETGDGEPAPPRDSLGNIQRIELPPGLSAADCRMPTQFGSGKNSAEQIAAADLRRACRQMKQVQTWLNMLVEPRTWLDSDTRPTDDATRRRWRYFGEFYRADTGNSCDPEAPPKSQSHPNKAFPRMAAVLLASDMPVDRSDVERFAEVGSDDWWWELPAEYAALVDPAGLDASLALRRATMREDVAAWIANAEIGIFAKPGAGGDYDFSAISMLSFLYLTRDRPELLQEYEGVNLVEKLITHGGEQLPVAWGERFFVACKSDPSQPDPWLADRWEHSGVFMSGPSFAQVYDSEMAVEDCTFEAKAFDSENHVLLQISYQYLINQWVAADYHQNLDAAALLGDVIPDNDPEIAGPSDWFVTDGPIKRELIDALARIVYAGFFETNARPYEAISTRAITLLASHADDLEVRGAAENALNLLATKFAFSSLDGRRWAPMRRNCEYVWRQSPYADDGVAQSLGTLSGAYKWNDSPYGLRRVVEGDGPGCVNDPGCYLRDFSFKWLSDPDPSERYADDAGIATVNNIDRFVMRSSTPELGALFASLTHYRLPPAVHEFMFDKHAGYWARMSSRFQREHYEPVQWGTPENRQPGYFDDVDLAPFDAGTHYERDPELWFAGRGYLNVAGGLYNAYYDAPEGETYDYPQAPLNSGRRCAGHGAWLGYLRDFGRTEEFATVNGSGSAACVSVPRRNPEIGTYDIASRPTTILLEVPREHSGTFEVYRPYGLGSFPIEVARDYLPVMLGHERTPWKSVNAASFKNFSYGYASACDVDGVCPNNGGGSALQLPPAWTDPADGDGDGVIVDSHSVVIGDGNVEFTIYDLREWATVRGMTALWLVTADVWKADADPLVDRASRSLWEVVPERPAFATIDDLVTHVSNFDAADFPASPSDAPYVYATAMSGERLVLGSRYGSVAPGEDVTPFADRIAGILEIQDAAGVALDPALQLDLDDLVGMDAMPLLEVLAVDEDYAFVDGGQGPQAYACARDGWLCVNNRNKWGIDTPDPDAAPTYLWVDARPQQGVWAPRWEWGSYDASEDWGCSCGAGFVPGPPASAVVEACSDPQQCAVDPWPASSPRPFTPAVARDEPNSARPSDPPPTGG